MIENGLIKSIENGKAAISLDLKGGCASCGMAGGCHASGTGKRDLALPVHDLDLKPGDWVEVETNPGSLLTAAFLIFILPLILSVTAYFIITEYTGSSGKALAGFFICFLISVGIVALIDKFFGKSRFFEPEIIGKTEPSVPDDKNTCEKNI